MKASVEINNATVVVEFEYLPEIPAILSGHPDDWEPGVPAEFELTSLSGGNNHLLEDENYVNLIEEQLNENQDLPQPCC